MNELISKFSPGSIPSWSTFFIVLAGLVAWWIRGMPDRRRADNERLRDEAGEEKHIRDEYAAQFKEYRIEVHKLNNTVAKLMARQGQLEKLLTQALSLSSSRRDQMTSMLTLIELLICELERLDKGSIIVPQAKALLRQMRQTAMPEDPSKSPALNSVEIALHDAERTVFSAERAIDEISEIEGKDKP